MLEVGTCTTDALLITGMKKRILKQGNKMDNLSNTRNLS